MHQIIVNTIAAKVFFQPSVLDFVISREPGEELYLRTSFFLNSAN